MRITKDKIEELPAGSMLLNGNKLWLLGKCLGRYIVQAADDRSQWEFVEHIDWRWCLVVFNPQDRRKMVRGCSNLAVA